MSKSKDAHNKQWFTLDNAGKIFPGQNSSTWSNIIRISANLREEIDPEILKKAVNSSMKRFPSFAVSLKKGFFWHYLENNDGEPPVRPDNNNPCVRIKYHENNKFLFRFFYYKKRITLEMFHALTDGYGAIIFLNTVVAEYLRLRGYDIPSGDMVLDINEKPTAEELEDSFKKNATKKVREKRRTISTYHRPGVKLPRHTSYITNGYIPLDILISKCKEKGVTITEYLSSVLAMIHMKIQKEENSRKQKEVSIQVPVNCRNHFGSKTLRNFSVCYSVRIDPNLGEYSFDEVLREFSLYLRYTNSKKHLQSMFAGNLGIENNPIMRIIPLFIKDAAVGIGFAFGAEATTTSLFTNVGINKIPEEMKKYVHSYTFMPSPGKVNGGRVGAVSCGNIMTVTFANCYNNTDIEREFFTFLIKQGIPVKIESNKNNKGDL